MRKTQPITVVQNYVSEISCNMCGKKINIIEEKVEDWQLDYFHNFAIHYGYGSSKDGESYLFDICEDCLDNIIKQFVVPVSVDK